LTLENPSVISKVTSMVGTPVLIDGNKLALSGRPIYLTTERAKLDLLKEQIRKGKLTGTKNFSLSLGLDMEKSTPAKPVLVVELANTTNRKQTPPTIQLAADDPWNVTPKAIEDKALLVVGEVRNYASALTGHSEHSGEISCVVTGRLSDTRDPVRMEPREWKRRFASPPSPRSRTA
jgi:hypothetical protein